MKLSNLYESFIDNAISNVIRDVRDTKRNVERKAGVVIRSDTLIVKGRTSRFL